MSNYEDAPATKILATHCAVCGRPLLDSISVESGIGPDCRKKYMRADGADTARLLTEAKNGEEANQIVYELACAISAAKGVDLDQVGRAAVASALLRLREMGYSKLADKLEAAWVQIRVTLLDGGERMAVKCPYSEESVNYMRRIPGRRWDPTAKINTFSTSTVSRAAVYLMLRRCFPGFAAIGPKGVFVVEPMKSRWDDDGERCTVGESAQC